MDNHDLEISIELMNSLAHIARRGNNGDALKRDVHALWERGRLLLAGKVSPDLLLIKPPDYEITIDEEQLLKAVRTCVKLQERER
jgi:hypothetical protein